MLAIWELTLLYFYLTHETSKNFLGFHTNRYKEAGEVGKKRKDDRIGWRIGLEYHIQKWLLVGLGYSYMDANSNGLLTPP